MLQEDVHLMVDDSIDVIKSALNAGISAILFARDGFASVPMVEQANRLGVLYAPGWDELLTMMI